MRERVLQKARYVLVFIQSLLLLGIPSMTAFAAEVGADYGDVNWLTTENNGTFTDATSKAKGIFGSGYVLVMAISGGLMVIFLIIGGLMFAGGSSRSKDEAKSKIFGVLVGGFIVFGAIGIISLVAGMANGAFSG